MKRICIREEDMIVLREIAEKYDMTVDKFCNSVLETNVGTTRQIRFTDEECSLLENIADSHSLTFNAFINMCLREYLANKDETSFDRKDILMKLDKKKREKRKNIDFNNIVFAQKINRLAVYYGIKLPSFVRYIVFKYIQENYDVDESGNVKIKDIKL